MAENLVDEFCTLSGVKVFVTSAGHVYSCILNQTNIEKNSNKFYIMQLLFTNTPTYYFYSRYGRVGENGNTSPLKVFLQEYLAVKEFQKIFRSKTGNLWDKDPKKFTPKYGKYILMDTIIPDIEVIEENPSISKISLSDSVSEFITSISNKKLMVKTMKNLDVDTSKLPLGKISKSQIDKAYFILKEIQQLITGDLNNIKEAGIFDPIKFIKDEVTKLSSEFWTLIPYSCGRTRPPVIKEKDQIEKCVKLLEIMDNIKIAGKIIRRTNNVEDIYNNLNIFIENVDNKTYEWSLIEKYVKNTHAPSHNYDIELLDIFKVDKKYHDNIDKNNFFDNLPDHRLLIHGSRMANYMGILSEGLRIPKSSQVSNGSVLGLGIYFADSVTKSFNYCQHSETNGIGYIVLCEVALGDNPNLVTKATFDERPTVGYTSRIALGNFAPSKEEMKILKTSSCDSVLVPCGKLKDSGTYSGFRYNEYVVYDSRQYRFRYILKLKTNVNF